MMQTTKGRGSWTLDGSVSGVMSVWSVLVKSECLRIVFAIFDNALELWCNGLIYNDKKIPSLGLFMYLRGEAS